MTYEIANAKLTGRNKMSRKLGNNTYLVRDADTIGVKLHNTIVVRYHADGAVELDSGGWRTVTTKARMNEFLPDGWGVYQSKHEWYVSQYKGDGIHGEPYLYADGMRIKGSRVLGAELAA